MAEPPPPPPPFQQPPFVGRGRSGRAWIQRPRSPMGFVPVNGHRLYTYGYAYSRGYAFVRPGLPRPRPQMGGNRFMETTREVVVQGQTSGLVNHGTGVFHPIIYNYRTSYTVYHPRVPFVYTNGANSNNDNKGKKKKLGAEAVNQISTTRDASNGTNAAGGSMESHELEPSSEIDFLPDEWTY